MGAGRKRGQSQISARPARVPVSGARISSPVLPRRLIEQGQLLCAVSQHVKQPLERAHEEQALKQLRSGGVALMAAMTSSSMMGGEGEIYAGLAKAVDFTDPFLNVFRGIIPPIGGMDLSIMIGFFLLSFVKGQLRRMAMGA
ncbi:MAG: hypothetical protein WDW38_009536 [Sanguina aurantia]